MELPELGSFASLQQYEERVAQLEGAGNSLDDARREVARSYYFDSWPELAEFVKAATGGDRQVELFETAVDAIVTGDQATLERLLRDNPELIRARSVRNHRGTLLNFVGANGTEKQRTPSNALEIAKVLLKAGADVNAAVRTYRGTTTLGLVATSVHPAKAGLQEPLIDMLLAHGASLEGAVAPDYTEGLVVNACLANGRPKAAAYLADKGARLNFEGAAGVGRLDVVQSLQPIARAEQLQRGFHWACGCGRLEVVRYLLEQGIDPAAVFDGATALHGAAYGAQPGVVRLLLEREVQVDVIDTHYEATPLGWALYGWQHPSPDIDRNDYHEVVKSLVTAGARVDEGWLNDEEMRSDSRMRAALTSNQRGRESGCC